ncbi:PA domain-containing protein [Sphingomonas nostoxanthinifaciens]|uniref:PA domain-containing protein n=1 Tax=Sphingomonas nostoxanthinifaciens TaxID=2872652 RepID=UPI001CC1FD35|nr:PA domain-containing protein [Sphingomonas nostoxanthinifaciens]UAK22941.1 PEPxxWA-CTERM sorting domain-containing protein [Sphingomonas nostoxanthinifaciens]
MKIHHAALIAGLLAAAPAYADSLFEQLSPTPTGYSAGTDYGIASPVYYLDGPHIIGPSVADVTGTIFRLAGSDGSYGLSLGCDAGDFGSGVAGHIVLLSRGTCLFAEKIHNAQNAGALAVLVADYDPAPPSLNYTGRDDAVTIFGFRISSALGQLLSDETLTQTTQVHMALGDNLVSSLAVPEPASWALFIGGFGMVGSAMRRRNTRVAFA